VIGPVAQIGWGSQAGFVKAKVGVVLCLPDPKIVLLGALEIAVPSTEVPDKVRSCSSGPRCSASSRPTTCC
jgi:hypothetical protein